MSDENLIVGVELKPVKTKETLSKVEKQAKESGEKAGRNIEQGFQKGFSGVAKAALTAAAAIGAAFGLKAVIRAAAAQEDAVNRLNSALIATGKFTPATSKSLQDFASELQKTTRFGDEVILQNQALIQSLGNLDEQGLKRATIAATNLAATLKIDLATASQLVGRAATGQVGAFTRYGIAIEKGKDAAETFENTLRALETRFGGAAQRDVKTFSGVYEQLSNTFGDLLEEVGFFITKSPEVVAVLDLIGKQFVLAIESVKGFREGLNITEDILLPLTNLSGVIINNVIPPFELLFNIAQIGFDSIVAGANVTVAAIARIGAEGAALAANFSGITGVTKEVADEMKIFADSSAEIAAESALKVGDSFKSALDFPISETLALKNEEMRMGLEVLNETTREQALMTQEIIAESVAATSELSETQATSLFDMLSNVRISLDDTAAKTAQTAKQIGQIINQGLTRSISGGIQTIVSSLAAGENAFKALGTFILSTIADMAIQLGQTLIFTGIGVESLKKLGGAAAIAAGAGLIALGAVMKSFAGGGGATSSPTSTGGNNFASLEPSIGVISDPQERERRQEQSSVNLTIQGDVFDSEESGLRIAQLISEAAGKSGAVIRDARFA